MVPQNPKGSKVAVAARWRQIGCCDEAHDVIAIRRDNDVMPACRVGEVNLTPFCLIARTIRRIRGAHVSH
jgi:hypothetical protein